MPSRPNSAASSRGADQTEPTDAVRLTNLVADQTTERVLGVGNACP
jgi:hypothetical protein